MQTIKVETPTARYEVHVGGGLVATLGARLKKLLPKLPRQVFVVTSAEIWALWGEALLGSFQAAMLAEPVALFLPAGEKNKTLGNVEKLARQLVEGEADRGSLLIAFGGGIVGDVCGFLAATYMRGIAYVQVPTTLLAQVDSSVGGKTGVNLPEGKNLVGAFHHPLAVYADVDVLGTLDERELRAGLMESVKAGFIRDRSLVRFMEENAEAVLARDAKALEKVIAASVRMKAEVVGLDEREGGLRMILNLGHTLGHAIEAATGYKAMLHGEAVGWGMIASLHVGVKRRSITPNEAARMEALIHRYCQLPRFKVSAAKLLEAATGDKKNVGGVKRFVVPVGVGNAAVLEDLSGAELEAAAKFMLAQAAEGSVL